MKFLLGKLEMDQPSIIIPVERTTNRQAQESISVVECLPPQTNTVVFRSHASSSSSAYYQYAFQPAIGEYSTRLLTWTVKDGQNFFLLKLYVHVFISIYFISECVYSYHNKHIS